MVRATILVKARFAGQIKLCKESGHASPPLISTAVMLSFDAIVHQ